VEEDQETIYANLSAYFDITSKQRHQKMNARISKEAVKAIADMVVACGAMATINRSSGRSIGTQY